MDACHVNKCPTIMGEREKKEKKGNFAATQGDVLPLALCVRQMRQRWWKQPSSWALSSPPEHRRLWRLKWSVAVSPAVSVTVAAFLWIVLVLFVSLFGVCSRNWPYITYRDLLCVFVCVCACVCVHVCVCVCVCVCDLYLHILALVLWDNFVCDSVCQKFDLYTFCLLFLPFWHRMPFYVQTVF